jgi:DNA primase
VGHAVATCGTALAEGHIRLLKNFAPRVVLAYDADRAGQAAAERFYEWEQKFEVDVVVAALPKGLDPADMARRDPAGLREAVSGAQPFLRFRLDRVLDQADLRSIEGRARTAARAMELVAEHPSSLVRDQYLMVVADRCRVDPEQLRSGVWRSWNNGAPSSAAGVAGGAARAARVRPPGSSNEPRPSGPEWEALRLLVHRPEAIALRLRPIFFDEELSARAYLALEAFPSLHDAIAGADPDVADLLSRLAVEDGDDDVDEVVIRLIERAGRRALTDLERDARSAPRPEDYSAAIGWLKHALEGLRGGQSGQDGETLLVAWLVSRFEAANE